jgi:hypothetical protein
VARRRTDCGERAADQQAAVGLRGNGVNGAGHRQIKCGIEFTVDVDARDIAARGRTDVGEPAGHQQFVVRLQRQLIDIRTGAVAVRSIDIGVECPERTVRADAGHLIARRAIDLGKSAADQDRAVRLHGDCQHVVIDIQTVVDKSRIETAVRVYLCQIVERNAIDGRKISADQDFAIGLQRERINTAVCHRLKVAVERAIRQQAQDENRVGVHGQIETAQYNAAIGLNEDGCHGRKGAKIRRHEAQVDAAIGIQARDAGSRLPGDVNELAADQDLTVALHRQAIHDAIGHRIERRIDAAVGVQSRDIADGRGADRGEPSADQDLPVGLHGNGIDKIAAADCHGETCIHTAVGVKACQFRAARAADMREIAADQDFPIRLNRHCVDLIVDLRRETVIDVLRVSTAYWAGQQECTQPCEHKGFYQARHNIAPQA